MRRPGWIAVLLAALFAAVVTWCVALVVLGGGGGASDGGPPAGHGNDPGDEQHPGERRAGPAAAATATAHDIPATEDAVRARIAEIERELAILRRGRGPRPRAAAPAPAGTPEARSGAPESPASPSFDPSEVVTFSGIETGTFRLKGASIRLPLLFRPDSPSVSAEDARLAAERYAAALRAGTDGSAWVPIALGGPKDRRDVLDPVLDVATDASVSPAGRAAALDTLTNAGSTAAAPTAEEILRSSTDTNLRGAALRSILAAVTAGAPVPGPVRYLAMDSGASQSEREMAITILARGDPPSALALLEPMVTNSDAATRARGVAILNASRNKVFLPLMIRTLHRDDLGDLAGPLTEAIADTKDRRWSARQLTGEPDTPRTGDYGTAWAAKQEEMGPVTIELAYDHPVVADRIRISETLCAGGVASIAVRGPGGAWETVWEGTAPAGTAPRWFEPPLRATSFATTAVRIVVDTNRVKGWEEIDCVELVGSGRAQWAATATATSSYAD